MRTVTTQPAASGPREIDWPTVLLGVLLGVAATVLAVAFKARCGLPPSDPQAFLDLCYSDITPLWFLERLDVGAVPYVDQPIAYPPLTGLWMWLAALGADDAASFYLNTGALLVCSGGIVGGLLAHTVGLRRTLVFAAAPSLVLGGAINWDLPSMALATAGLVAHRRGADGWAGAWLGLGTAAKLWPVLLVPGVVLGAAGMRGWRAGARAAAGAAGAWLVTNVPVAVVAPEGWFRFLQVSGERPATASSLWQLGPDLLGVSLAPATMNVWSGVLTLLGCGAALGWALWRDHPRSWHLAGLPLAACFILASKVYSPQFTLWLLPLLALALPPVWALVAFLAADIAVHLTLFPYIAQFSGVDAVRPIGPLNWATGARAALLVIVVLWGWRREVGRAVASHDPPRVPT